MELRTAGRDAVDVLHTYSLTALRDALMKHRPGRRASGFTGEEKRMDNPLARGLKMGILLATIASLGSGCSLPGAEPPPPNLVVKLSGHGLWVNSVTWSPDGTRVA